MGQRLAKIMDLRDGETAPVLQAFVALFGIIAGHTILETARDALFLSKLPPSRLALVYVVLAAATLVASSWNARFVRRFGQRNALIFTLLTAAHGTALIHFLPPTPAVLFFLYAWSALIGTLLGVQFWMFAGQRFTVAQGKRLFGPVASGGVGGAVVGATGAAALLAIVPVGALLLVSSALFLVTAIFLTTVPSAPPEEAPISSARLGPAPAPRAESVGALFRRYPYLRQMALLSLVSTAALLTTDYLFKLIASQRIPAADLGSFFARTYAVLNAVSLAVQLLVAGRILRQLGVLPALLILPFLLLGGSVGLFVTGGALLMALLTKGSDGSLRYSLHRVASELLWMPLPGEVRDRSKALLDSVLGRAVQAVMAGLLLLLAALEVGTPRVLAAIVAVLSLAWLVVAISMRRSYLDLFRQALAKGATDLDAGAAELDLSAVEALLEALSSREPPRVIAAMELLHEKKRSGLIPGLILYHESEEVLIRALGIAAETKRPAWLPLIERLLNHGTEAVRVGAVRALAAQGEREALRPALGDPSPAVRARAAHALACGGPQDNPLDDPTIAELFTLEGEAGRAVKLALLDAIRDQEDPRWADVVVRLSREADPDVVDHAVLSMGHLDDPRFIPILIERLTLREGRASAREALVRQGEAAFEALDLALRDPGTPPLLRVHLPRTLSRFGTQRAVDRLTELLVHEPAGFVRYKALRGLGRLAQVDPEAPVRGAQKPLKIDREKISAEMRKNLVEHLRLLSLSTPIEARKGVRLDAAAEGSASLVLGLLADKKKHALERAFRLLQMVHRREDIRRAYDALRSESGRLRAQAMEFLDTLAVGRNRGSAENRDGRELLRLVADDLPAAERVSRAARFVRSPPSTYEEALRALLTDPDDLLATFAAYHALDLDTPALREEVAALCLARPHLNIATPLSLHPPGSTHPPTPELALGSP